MCTDLQPVRKQAAGNNSDLRPSTESREHVGAAAQGEYSIVCLCTLTTCPKSFGAERFPDLGVCHFDINKIGLSTALQMQTGHCHEIPDHVRHCRFHGSARFAGEKSLAERATDEDSRDKTHGA